MITKDEKENVGLSVDATKDEKLGFLVCGALGQEILDIINKNSWMADVIGIPAIDHSFPERIAPDVEKRILEYKSKYKRLIVVYGDCGTKGALDDVLSCYGIYRISGPPLLRDVRD